MVTEIFEYKCPYCDTKHGDEDDVIECIKEHLFQERNIDNYENILYECEMCKKRFKYNKEAIDCEKNHKEKDDLYYGEFIMKEGYKKLEAASMAKGQEKLDFGMFKKRCKDCHHSLPAKNEAYVGCILLNTEKISSNDVVGNIHSGWIGGRMIVNGFVIHKDSYCKVKFTLS